MLWSEGQRSSGVDLNMMSQQLYSSSRQTQLVEGTIFIEECINKESLSSTVFPSKKCLSFTLWLCAAEKMQSGKYSINLWIRARLRMPQLWCSLWFNLIQFAIFCVDSEPVCFQDSFYGEPFHLFTLLFQTKRLYTSRHVGAVNDDYKICRSIRERELDQEIMFMTHWQRILEKNGGHR